MMSFLIFSLGVYILTWALLDPIRARVRNDEFRQDLYDIRDRLFDEMREARALDDPAHRALRSVLNHLIRIAPVLSPPLWITLAASADARDAIVTTVRQAGDIEAAQRAVDSALDATCRRLAQRLLKESLIGRTVSLVARVYVLREAIQMMLTSQVRHQVLTLASEAAVAGAPPPELRRAA